VFVQESDRYRLVDLDTTSRGSRTGRRRRRASELAPGRGRLRRYRSHTAPAAAVGVLGDSSVHWKLAFEQCLSEVRAPVDLDGRLLAPGDDRYWNPLSHGLRFGLVPCCCFERGLGTWLTSCHRESRIHTQLLIDRAHSTVISHRPFGGTVLSLILYLYLLRRRPSVEYKMTTQKKNPEFKPNETRYSAAEPTDSVRVSKLRSDIQPKATTRYGPSPSVACSRCWRSSWFRCSSSPATSFGY